MSRPQQQQQHQQQQQRQASTVAFAPGADWILLSQGAEARVWKVPHFPRPVATATSSTVVAICKERFSKSYRHRDLDERLTKQRCRTEARLLEKLGATTTTTKQADSTRLLLDVPKVLRVENTNYPEPALLYLEYVDGTTVRDYLEDNVLATNQHDKDNNNTTTTTTLVLPKLAESMGSMIAQLHAEGMVHGDLTTSNMMLRREIVLLEQSSATAAPITITLIDFGLAKHTTSAEERAVDLYVLERALQSTHPTLPASFWETVLQVYAASTTATTTTKEATTASKTKSTHRRGGTADATLARLEQVRQRGRKRECFG